MELEALPGALPGLALILARLSSALVVAPLTGERRGPKLMAITIAAGATLAIGMGRPLPATLPTTGFALAAAGEAMIGLLIGLAARMALLPAELLGESAANEAGLTIAASLDPVHAEPTPALQALVRAAAILLFAALGGLDAVLLLLGNSFDVVPAGAAAAVCCRPDALSLVPLLLAKAALAAVLLALPILAASALATASVAVLARAVPRLNLISDVVPLRTLAVVTALGVTLPLLAPSISAALGALPGLLGMTPAVVR